jgi:hypothetical protein|tara:strand:- start:39 stop:716 length:678 start_codon:yes stop_codon:yes gene_type:complete
MNTKQTVYKMLIENTGKHFLDSGGDSGRMWQRNQKKTIQDFENEPEESYEFDFNGGYIYRTLSVFHYLTNNLQIDDLCEDFNNLQNDSNDWDSNCNLYGVSAEAYEILDTLPDVRILRTWNTYNGESDLSQILQGATIEIDEETYFCIQIHGGADARGGYTNAKLFKGGNYCDGMIHEYLFEYKDSLEVEQDLEEGYIETFTDYLDESITYTSEQVNKRIKEINH